MSSTVSGVMVFHSARHLLKRKKVQTDAQHHCSTGISCEVTFLYSKRNKFLVYLELLFLPKNADSFSFICGPWASSCSGVLWLYHYPITAARAGWSIPLSAMVVFPDCNVEVPLIKRRLGPQALLLMSALLKTLWAGSGYHLTLDVNWHLVFEAFSSCMIR